jgi:hypothetical protein
MKTNKQIISKNRKEFRENAKEKISERGKN